METTKSKQIEVEPRVSNLEWIVEFRKEVGTDENVEILNSTYPFIVPHQMRVLKESAYSPQTGLYLGLNSRDPGTSQENSMQKLKARWTRIYLSQRRKTVPTMDTSKVPSSRSNYSEWDSLVYDSLLPILQDSFKRFALTDDQHHEDEMKEVLVADAMFIFMYLLHNRPPPESEFSWLKTQPLFVPNGIPISYDIFLLENQIPLQLLEHIARDVFHNFQVFVPVNIPRLYNRDIVPGLLVDQINNLAEIVIREVVSEAMMSRFRSVFRVSSQFESRNCLQELVLQFQFQDCDHLLDYLLRVTCYKPSAEQRHKNMGQWALGRWKGDGLSDSTIEWGFEDTQDRIRYDLNSLIGSKSDLENHLRSLRGATEEEISEITVERLVDSLRVRMRPRFPDPSLNSIGFTEDLHRPFSELSFKYLMRPEHILRFVAVEYGIAPNIVRAAIENHYIYVDPEPRDPKTMESEQRDLLAILQYVRVILSLAGTPSSGILAVSSFLSLAHTPRWARLLFIRSILKIVLVQDIYLSFLLREPKVGHISAWIISLLMRLSLWVDYLLYTALGFVELVYTSIWFRLLSRIAITSNKYFDLQFRSPNKFNKLLVSTLKRVGSDRYGLIFIYFAERILLQEALSHALQPKIHATEPALAQVLQEAIEARADFMEFPLYARGGWLPPHREINSPMNARWNKRLLKDHDYMKEDNWRIPSATKLKKAGIGIETCDLIHQTHLNLSGHKPILRLPKLLVNDEADSLLRNLAALERFKGPLSETPLASFIKLMDNLIDTPEDVSVLRDAGVIVHHLGNDADVANLWNGMGSGLRQCPSERWALMLTYVNILSRDKKRLIWTEFKTKYMSRPWLVTGTVAAIMLVLLAIVQTVFTGFQVFFPMPL